MAYCPQICALLDFMTPFEILKYMTMLRGASCCKLNYRIAEMLKQSGLEKEAHMLVRKLSPGTKRKLNVALALV